ncbi:MAG TPA: hypothetical protein VJZ27_18080, partial [Aggregatilineales bacterium]|nr:hypothetical protein [Aggregatilineales bacterium]
NLSGVFALDWSPDGNWLIAAAFASNNRAALYRVSRDGSLIQRLLESNNGLADPDWGDPVEMPWHGWRVLVVGVAFLLVGLGLSGFGGKKRRIAGGARGQIIIAPDFEAPLTDFNEYME